jgi:hypothetical protein
MQIQLKQNEIIVALKQYIESQGINLACKEVTISFTAGRKESGIIADLGIEDAAIPGFTNSDAVESKVPSLAVVSAPAVLAVTEAEAVVSEEKEALHSEATSLEVDGAVTVGARTASLFS